MDPWCEDSNTDSDKRLPRNYFQDSFCKLPQTVDCDTHVVQESTPRCSATFHNEIYLNKLEQRLEKLQREKQKATNLTAKSMLNALQSKKKNYFEQSLTEQPDVHPSQTLSDADVFWDDDTTSERTFSADIKRKLYPDQQAISPVELLQLLKHDVCQQVNSSDQDVDSR